MKYLLSLIVTISILCTSLSAVEYFNISLEQNQFHDEFVTLNDGDYLEIIGCSHYGAKYIGILSLDSPLNINDIDYDNFRQKGFIIASRGIEIAGPAKITFYGVDSTVNIPIFTSFKLTRASEVEYKNVNIISLPTATVGAGTHEIVVEASDDLQTWTPVHSSSIGGNKAFFRTRVVEAGE